MSAQAPIGTSQPESLQVLLDATSMVLATSSEPAVLAGILDLAGKIFAADACAVWRQFDGGLVWRTVATRGLSESYRTEIVNTSEIEFSSIEAIGDLANDESLSRFRSVYEAEGIRAILVVPLNFQGRPGGTITFYWHAPRAFSQLDRDYALAVANLAGAALTINELHEQNDREKHRLSFLAEASAVLASSLDYETTLQRVARLAVPHIADWCTVHIIEDGVPNRLIVTHADPAMLAFAEDFSRRYPEEIRPDTGLGAVLRTGVTEVYAQIPDEILVAAAIDDEHLAMMRKLELTSSIVVALSSRGKVLGAIRLLSAGGDRIFTKDDVQLAEDLARRAGVAIENAQLHRAVLEQENQLRLSHAAGRMGSWSWDLIDRKIVWSDEFKAMHGLPPEMPAGYEGGAELVHPDDRVGTIRQLAEVLASDATQLTSEHRVITPDGRTLWIQSRGRIDRDADGKAVAIHGISIDVTESRQAEQTMRRTEKLAAAGRLAATVAHEINNPLEALMNLIFLAGATDGLPPEAAVFLNTAEDELNRMAHIVRQTLGFYRESVHPKPADISTIVSGVVELYRSRAASRSLRLTCRVEPELIATVNGGEINQVIANLISNAIDATPPDGTVEATVSRLPGAIQIVISDSGSGIESQNLARLFEPFFTTKADVGTGLGLWVSKGIIDKHNGLIEVASQTSSPSGTRMTITLPLD